MKGDFTRVTFDPAKHYSGVLEQQGRMQVDSDRNEMNDIHRYFSRRLAADLIGPHGGPGDGFDIVLAKDEEDNEVLRDFGVKAGHYYVDGVLCENDGAVLYTNQSGSPLGLDNLEDGNRYLAYLDVWERHVTAYEDEDEYKIGIREVALRGPDTATRARVVWQVKARLVTDPDDNNMDDANPDKAYSNFLTFLGDTKLGSGQLRARAIKPKADDEPCLISPESRYRGAENQLYRVEIHHGGIGMPPDAAANANVDKTKVATFKWSRENGSVIFPITHMEGNVVTLRDLGRESRFGLRPNDWVEIVDDDYVLQNRAEPLLQIDTIERDSMRVTLKTTPAAQVGTDSTKHPLLRRWDQPSKAIMVVETAGDYDSDWIFTLEDGIQIQFSGAEQSGGGGTPAPASYRTGDYWLIPARVATGDVEWPGPPGIPQARPPHGVEHGFAPLRIFSIGVGGHVTLGTNLRRTINPLAKVVP
ncbi:MAG TPA: DUF6519 domain-containing protein [Blastocatellia bacterium]|nr:DUF6519 domain-containing protein [Blastocatellia bacterium]